MTNISYDVVPYESLPFPQTRPQNLYTIGQLFGMQPANFRNARVLELGCASGGNLIPMAAEYPNSRFVGVDFSKVQIDEALKHIAFLKLTNIKFEAISVLDMTPSFGTFDYLIAHGLLSWVPDNVKDKIFQLAKGLLSENGIAYISYNTLPGWNMAKSLREMMFYHTNRFDDPATKATQARALLAFIGEGIGETQSAHSEAIKYEQEYLSRFPDSYLLHDHLEEHNDPMYFYEFMERAHHVDLQYLGDVELNTMFSGNFPTQTAEILNSSNDIIRKEQYMDFVRNRRFRSTLLCHSTVQLNRSVDGKLIDKFYLTTKLKPDKDFGDQPVFDDQRVVFNGPCTFIAENRIITSTMQTLYEERNKPISGDQLVARVRKRLGLSDDAPVRTVLREHGIRLAFADGISLESDAGNFTLAVSDKPKTTKLVRYQASFSNWVTNQKHEKVDVDIFTRAVLQQLDGTKNEDHISEHIIALIEKGELSIQQNGSAIIDKGSIHRLVRDILRRTLQNLALNSLIIPSD